MRTNRGKPSGQYLAQLGNWNLYQTADGKYKVCAVDPVNGKANYSFAVDGQKIDTHAALDSKKLKDERPELYATIESYFKTAEVVPSSASSDQQEASDDGDPYGDLALSRRRKLTTQQNWKRGLLQMRRVDLEHLAVKKASIWESAIRMLYAGVFGAKIDDATAQQAFAWVTQHQGKVDLGVLLQIERDYYAGKYAPNSCATLESQLDLLAGRSEQPTEAINGTGGLQSNIYTESTGSANASPTGSDESTSRLRTGGSAGSDENGRLRARKDDFPGRGDDFSDFL